MRVSDEDLNRLESTMPESGGNAFIEGSKLLIADLRDARAEIAKLKGLLTSAADHVDGAMYLFAEEDNLDEEDGRVAMDLVDDCREALGLPALPSHFVCEDCGEHVAVDEDGCCASCGADCRTVRCNCETTTGAEPAS